MKFLAALLLLLPACKGSGAHGSGAPKHEQDFEMHEPAVSMARAIEAAQKSEPAKLVISADFGWNITGTQVLWVVLLADTHEKRQVEVDAASAALVQSDRMASVGSAALQYLADSASISVHGPQAIEAALKKVPGTWCFALQLGREEGAIVWFVALAGDHKWRVAEVSAADGNVLKVADVDKEQG